MKKNIIIIIFLILITSIIGVFLFKQNEIKQKEFIFEKNKECRSLLEKHSEILKDIKLISNFYSIKENSCILIIYGKNNTYKNGKDIELIKNSNGHFIGKENPIENSNEFINVIDLLNIKSIKLISSDGVIKGGKLIESKIDLDNGICLNNSKKEECADFINYYKSLLN